MTIANFTIKINRIEMDKKINLFIKTVHEQYLNTVLIDESLQEIRDRILDSTEAYINAHRRRPPSPNKIGETLMGVLRETAYIQKVDNSTYRMSIGDEKVLDEKVPYWRVVNYGGIPWGGASFFGLFEDGKPKAGGGGKAFIEGATTLGTGDKKNGLVMMTPKDPIPPMHYINYMAQLLSKEIKQFKVRKKR